MGQDMDNVLITVHTGLFQGHRDYLGENMSFCTTRVMVVQGGRQREDMLLLCQIDIYCSHDLVKKGSIKKHDF